MQMCRKKLRRIRRYSLLRWDRNLDHIITALRQRRRITKGIPVWYLLVYRLVWSGEWTTICVILIGHRQEAKPGSVTNIIWLCWLNTEPSQRARIFYSGLKSMVPLVKHMLSTIEPKLLSYSLQIFVDPASTWNGRGYVQSMDLWHTL